MLDSTELYLQNQRAINILFVATDCERQLSVSNSLAIAKACAAYLKQPDNGYKIFEGYSAKYNPYFCK